MLDRIILKNHLKNLYYKFFGKKLLKNFPDWKDILRNIKFNDKDVDNSKKILIATSTGGHRHAISAEILFGLSLKARGVKVDFLLCDHNLPACSEITYMDYKKKKDFINYGSSIKCSSCWNAGKYSLTQANFNILKFSDFIDPKDLKEARGILEKTDYDKIRHFKIDDISIGEHAYAGALRYHARGELDYSDDDVLILKKYFFSALKTYFVSKNLFMSQNFNLLVLNHGIYVPQGIISEVAKKKGLKVVTWFTAYKNRSFLFSHNETYHKSLLKEPNNEWENNILSIEDEKKLDDYISSRKLGSQDWVYFHNKNPKFSFNLNNYIKNGNDTFVSLFTNVVWDAQLFFDQNIFKNMLEWLFETIDYFIKIDKILVIRAHPAEISGTLPSKQKIYDELKKKYGSLPKNIIFIPPEDPTSSYSIIEKSKFCIVYGSTIGTEIAAMGKNVLVGGEAWIKNKEISYDPRSKLEYFQLISKLISNSHMSIEKHKRAKKYAYHFFFKRMIPVNLIETKKEKYQDFIIKEENIKKIFPFGDYDKGIETICDSILNNKNFIYEE